MPGRKLGRDARVPRQQGEVCEQTQINAHLFPQPRALHGEDQATTRLEATQLNELRYLRVAQEELAFAK